MHFIKKKLGSTLTTLALYKGRYMIAHVGDSRIYQWKLQPYHINQTDRLYETDIETESLDVEQTLSQLTDDHSWFSNKLNKVNCRNKKQKNIRRHVIAMFGD